MITATLARPYAKAVFHIAETGDMEMWSTLLCNAAQIVIHRQVKALIHNPRLSKQQISSLFFSILAATTRTPLSQAVQNLVHILTANQRLMLLPEIASQFSALKNQRAGITVAEITSALTLSDAQLQDVVTALEKRFGRVEPRVNIEPALMGGIRIVVGDLVLDASVRAKLQRLHQQLEHS